MARKVFISFLGTSNYVQTKYDLNGTVMKPVRFIQEALTDYYCTDWSENDRIFIFYTSTSCELNWKDNGQIKTVENKEIESKGLEGILKSKSFGQIVDGCEICEGFSEAEVWEIFNVVYSKLEEGDDVIFDVTHAFRSIPMFSSVLFNFARFTKNIVLRKIHYGAFEKLGFAQTVVQMPLEKRIAPVLDLSNMVRLQEYTEIASNFMSFGRIGKLSRALSEEGSSAVLQQLSKAINDFDASIFINRMDIIENGKTILAIRNSLKAARKNVSDPVKKVLSLLEEEIKPFKSEKSFDNIKAAVDWAYKYKMLPQAYTLGEEYIITLCAARLQAESPFKNNNKGKKEFREFVSSLIQISQEDLDNGVLRGTLQDYSELLYRLSDIGWVKLLKKQFSELARLRNSINHAKRDETTYDDFDFLFHHYHDCLKLLSSDVNHAEDESMSPCFINLSNHPSDKWDEAQLRDAEKLGKITDLPFPMIDECGDEDYIASLLREYIEKIRTIAPEPDATTIHIMGEMTFVFSLVRVLKEEGYTCVASTTKRIVETLPDGDKKVRFEFARFRKY